MLNSLLMLAAQATPPCPPCPPSGWPVESYVLLMTTFFGGCTTFLAMYRNGQTAGALAKANSMTPDNTPDVKVPSMLNIKPFIGRGGDNK